MVLVFNVFRQMNKSIVCNVMRSWCDVSLGHFDNTETEVCRSWRWHVLHNLY